MERWLNRMLPISAILNPCHYVYKLLSQWLNIRIVYYLRGTGGENHQIDHVNTAAAPIFSRPPLYVYTANNANINEWMVPILLNSLKRV
jgi:hypothetical protein